MVIGSGAIKGTIPAGISTALHEAIPNIADLVTAVAVSTGAPVCLYTWSDMPEEGSKIYYKTIPKEGIVNPYRLKQGVIDNVRLDELYRADHPDEIIELVRSRKREFHVGVTRTNGVLDYLSSHDPNIDLVSAVVASGLIPRLCKEEHISINGVPYVDGGIVQPLPVEDAVDQFGGRRLIVISPYSPEELKKESYKEKVYASILPVWIKRSI